jgi:hypothetical protein
MRLRERRAAFGNEAFVVRRAPASRRMEGEGEAAWVARCALDSVPKGRPRRLFLFLLSQRPMFDIVEDPQRVQSRDFETSVQGHVAVQLP